MCGIVGIGQAGRGPGVTEERLRRMCDAIRHRGPDDTGLFTDGPVGLGMRRLSIIDVSGGHQPVFNEDRSCAIVYNGEIYNYRALRAELIAKGHVMRTNSDTETIVHLYEEHGPRCVERLRGMFAFAIWDAPRQQLFIARDRFGIKPLYYHAGPDGIAFASELKALRAAGVMGSELDWQALEAYFRLGYIPAPRTPFQDVQKLEPAHTITWRPGRPPEIARYWDLPTGATRSLDEVEDRVRAALDDTVKAHLESDVPVAAFLSGGLDSSAVVSSMAMAGQDVHAFTVRYSGSGATGTDETPLAQLLASRYGVKLSVVDVAPEVTEILVPIVESLDEPLADDSAVPTWLMCKRVAEEYKVALVGTGGDELFAGYRRHFALAAAAGWQRMPSVLRSGARALADRLPDSRAGNLGVGRVKRFLRSSGDSLAARYLSLQDRLGGNQLFSADVRASIDAAYARSTFERHAAAGPTSGLIRPALYLDYKTYLPDQLLHLADRISMAHSLELRVPLVDHELVETIFPLSDWTRVGAMRPKRLLRRALRPRLPEAHFSAPKRGFVGPTSMWLRNELAGLLADELSPERMRRLGYFDPQVVERMRQEHADRRQNHATALWSLLCFSIWHRSTLEGSGASPRAASSITHR